MFIHGDVLIVLKNSDYSKVRVWLIELFLTISGMTLVSLALPRACVARWT